MANISYDEFKSKLHDETLRRSIGVRLSDADAKAVLSEDRFTQSYYKTWLRHENYEAPEYVELPPRTYFPWKIALIGVVVVGGIIWFSSSRPTEPVYDKVSAYTYCQIEVKKNLKSPDSARFSDMTASGSGGTWTARGTVRSENSFGAMVPATFECSIIEGKKIRLDRLEQLD